jgi:MFS family permease
MTTDQNTDPSLKETGVCLSEPPNKPLKKDPTNIANLPIQYEYLTFSTDFPSPQTSIPRPSLKKYSDPLSWTKGRKAFVTWLSCLSTLVTTYTPGAYASGLDQYKKQWGISSTDVYAGITTFTLCFALAPMILAPFSELQGRRPVFLVAGLVYCISQIGSGVTASFAGLLVTRAIAGVSCSVFSTMVGGVISDIYIAKERNTAMAIFSGAAIAGSGIGPMVSSIISQHLSWRWIYYVQTISCSIVVAALFVAFPETRGSVLLSRRASLLNGWYERIEQEASNYLDHATTSYPKPSHIRDAKLLRWKVKADEERGTLASLIKISLTRPLYLLFTESVVFWFSMWMAFAWTILYLTFEALPLLFTRTYNFNHQENGLVFIAVIVAAIVATMMAIWQESLLYRRWLPESLRIRPERRLYFACIQSLFLPIGLFWLGSTLSPSIHWIVPIIAVGFITLGIYSVYLAVFNYLADTYQIYASSAIAAQSFVRNVFAACVPLATDHMFGKLGTKGGSYLLGGVGFALSAVPWILVIWGGSIRKRSKIARHLVE